MYCLNEWIIWSPEPISSLELPECGVPHRSLPSPLHRSTFYSRVLQNDSIPHPTYVSLLGLKTTAKCGLPTPAPGSAPTFLLTVVHFHKHFMRSFLHPCLSPPSTFQFCSFLISKCDLQNGAQLLSFASNRWTESSLLHVLLMDTLSPPNSWLPLLSVWLRVAKIGTCIHTRPHTWPCQKYTLHKLRRTWKEWTFLALL